MTDNNNNIVNIIDIFECEECHITKPQSDIIEDDTDIIICFDCYMKNLNDTIMN